MSGNRNPEAPNTAYFDALKRYNFNSEQKRYGAALVGIKDGLRSAPGFFNSSERGIPLTTPFTHSAAGAIAALFNDQEAFLLMDAVAVLLAPRRRPDIGDYRQDAKTMQAIRDDLVLSSPATITHLKSLTDRRGAGRVSRLVAWMEKHGEVWTLKEGAATLVHWGPPRLRGSVVVEAFRGGLPATKVERFRVGRTASGYSAYRPVIEGTVPAREMPLNASDRQSTTMSTYLMRDGVWLVGKPSASSNGASTTKVSTKDLRGDAMQEFTLPFAIVRAFTSANRDCIVLLDKLLTVYVCDFAGNSISRFSLANNPDFQRVYQQTNQQTDPSALVRSVDVSTVTGDILFSTLDFVWRFTSSGKRLSALRFTPDAVGQAPWADVTTNPPGSHLAIPNVSMEYLESQNWVYFARFSDIDDSTYIGLYDGQTFKLSPEGVRQASWSLGSAPDEILEVDDVTVAANYDIRVLQQFGTKAYAGWGGTLISRSGLFVHRRGRSVSVFDIGIGEGRRFVFKRDIRAIYPTEGGVRVETTSTYADLSVSEV